MKQTPAPLSDAGPRRQHRIGGFREGAMGGSIRRMDKDEAIKLLRGGPGGIKEWNKWRKKKLPPPDLSSAVLNGANLSGANLNGANLSGAGLSGTNLRKANLTAANLGGANLTAANLREANLSGAGLSGARLISAYLGYADLSGANLSRAYLSYADLSGADLNGAGLSGADLSDANLTAANLGGANLSRANLRWVNLSKANLTAANLGGANLEAVNLSGADLSGAHFESARLVRADLAGAKVDRDTRFSKAEVEQCKIDRHTLESLDDYGGLTKGDRMLMQIVDGVATLRASYSGFWLWFHLVALAVFLFPYVSFILTRWLQARFGPPSSETIALWKAAGRYIWNGGENWRLGWDLHVVSFGAFVVLLLYNLLRGFLLLKTKVLELQQESSGLPARFTLDGWWGRLYRVAQIGIYINLLLVFVHTWHFLQQRIPLTDL